MSRIDPKSPLGRHRLAVQRLGNSRGGQDVICGGTRIGEIRFNSDRHGWEALFGGAVVGIANTAHGAADIVVSTHVSKTEWIAACEKAAGGNK